MTSNAKDFAFETHRPELFALAYRMLGSVAEAEDVVQDAFLRWEAASRADVESPRAFLSTVVTRLCLDYWKSARVRRETYVGPWLPEPLRTDGSIDADSISMAFLVLLESLTPTERAAFLLHSVFDYSHAEIAAILQKDEATCRQLLHRAKEHVRARRPRFSATREQHERLLASFIAACAQGDVEALKRILATDATAWSDGGGRVAAALHPIRGAEKVARFFIGVVRKAPPDLGTEIADVNGWPSVVVLAGGRPIQILTLETDGERIHTLRVVANPDKLLGVGTRRSRRG